MRVSGISNAAIARHVRAPVAHGAFARTGNTTRPASFDQDCLGNMTSDIQAVCDYTPSAGILGLYMNYTTPTQANDFIDTVNSAMNSCEY
jgi:hypothetical protein